MKKAIMILFIPVFILFTTSAVFNNTKSSYIVLEKSSKRVLEGENFNEQLLIASTAKVLTAITVIENYDLNEEIAISSKDVSEEGSKVYLQENERIKRIDLLYALMLRSANDAASALSDNNSAEFIYKMNETAKKIGMHSSVFENASGLDEREYNLSTAYDMAILSAYAANNEVFLSIAGAHKYTCKSSFRGYTWLNKHKLVYNDDSFVFGKTGYTKKAKRILISNYVKDNMDVIIVTINKNDDWNFHRKLIDSLKDYDFKCIYKKSIEEIFIDKKYYILITRNVIIPIKENEYDKIAIKFLIYNNNAVMNIYLDNEIIARYEFNVKYELDINDYMNIYL